MALGLLALSLQPLLAGNATGSNLGGAFAARQVTADTLLAPFYFVGSPGYAASSGTTAAPGSPQPNLCYYHTASTMTVGTGWGCALTGDTDVGDGSTVKYLVEIANPSSNCGTDMVVGLASANCTISGVTQGTAAACTAMRNTAASPNWSTVCTLVLNSGATHPDIQLKYVSGANNRSYCDVIRYTRQAIPCQNAGPCTIQGPVSTNQTTVTVLGVTNAADQYVIVYQKNTAGTETMIGYLDTGIVVGANVVPVTWDATSRGAQIIATQTTPSGQEGCKNYGGAYVVGGGPNPSIRVSINCRTSASGLNAGPVGANSDGSVIPGLFFIPGPDSATPQSPQSTGMIITANTNWQTITIDPRTAHKGWVWSGTGSGTALSETRDHIATWAGWESLILNMYDLTDTGPFDIYLDNFYSGADPVTPPCNQPLAWGFETNSVGDTQLFLHPAYSGYPAPGQFEGPESALVSNLQSAGGTNSVRVRFQFSGYSAENWVRLLADGGYFTYPQIKMDAPFQFDMLLLPKGATQGRAVGNAPPIADQTNCPGMAFTVCVSVTPPVDPTTDTPLVRNYTYQWKKSGSATVLSTDSCYTKNPAVDADAGTYSVVIGDGSGNTLTRSMILMVPQVVSIDTQPTDQGPMPIGSSAFFGVGASVDPLCPCANTPPLTYQWYFNGAPIAGATDASYTFNGLTVDMTNAGSYTVVVSNTCAAQQKTTVIAKLYVTDPAVTPLNNCGTGMLGLYYTNRLYTAANPFAAPVTETIIDPQINFNWAAGSFDAGNYPLALDTFVVRWVGTIQAPYPGQTYKFYTTTDDGVRLYVNGNLLINKWVLQGSTTWNGSIVLGANPVELIMEYFEQTGSAVAELAWESASVQSNVVPASALCAADPNTAIPPIIALNAPANNATDTLGTPVTLTATVTPESATVNAVKFYSTSSTGFIDPTNWLATVVAPGPYTTNWTPPAVGVYYIGAQVVYNTTNKLDSVAANKLTVSQPPASPVTITSIINNNNGTATINYTGGSGTAFVLERSTNGIIAGVVTGWIPWATNNPSDPKAFTIDLRSAYELERIHSE